MTVFSKLALAAIAGASGAAAQHKVHGSVTFDRLMEAGSASDGKRKHGHDTFETEDASGGKDGHKRSKIGIAVDEAELSASGLESVLNQLADTADMGRLPGFEDGEGPADIEAASQKGKDMQVVNEAFKNMFSQIDADATAENQWFVPDGEIYVPEVVEGGSMNNIITASGGNEYTKYADTQCMPPNLLGSNCESCVEDIIDDAYGLNDQDFADYTAEYNDIENICMDQCDGGNCDAFQIIETTGNKRCRMFKLAAGKTCDLTTSNSKYNTYILNRRRRLSRSKAPGRRLSAATARAPPAAELLPGAACAAGAALSAAQCSGAARALGARLETPLGFAAVRRLSNLPAGCSMVELAGKSIVLFNGAEGGALAVSEKARAAAASLCVAAPAPARARGRRLHGDEDYKHISPLYLDSAIDGKYKYEDASGYLHEHAHGEDQEYSHSHKSTAKESVKFEGTSGIFGHILDTQMDRVRKMNADWGMKSLRGQCDKVKEDWSDAEEECTMSITKPACSTYVDFYDEALALRPADQNCRGFCREAAKRDATKAYESARPYGGRECEASSDANVKTDPRTDRICTDNTNFIMDWTYASAAVRCYSKTNKEVDDEGNSITNPTWTIPDRILAMLPVDEDGKLPSPRIGKVFYPDGGVSIGDAFPKKNEHMHGRRLHEDEKDGANMGLFRYLNDLAIGQYTEAKMADPSKYPTDTRAFNQLRNCLADLNTKEGDEEAHGFGEYDTNNGTFVPLEGWMLNKESFRYCIETMDIRWSNDLAWCCRAEHEMVCECGAKLDSGKRQYQDEEGYFA